MANSARVKCMIRGCTSWGFEGMLCRIHLRDNPDAAKSLNINWEPYKTAAPLVPNMFVVHLSDNILHVELEAGECVDVIQMCSDNTTAIVRRKIGNQVGYYDYYSLNTEQQVMESYQAEIERQEMLRQQQAKQAEIDRARQYEEEMRQRAVERAEAERRMREQEIEQRRLEEEMQARAAEEEQRRQHEESKRREEEYRKWLAEHEAQMEKLKQQRMEEARILREQSDMENQTKLQQKEEEARRYHEEQARKKDEAFLNSLPSWKRDLVLRKRQQVSG